MNSREILNQQREILDQLIIGGKITEEDITEASSRILTSDTKELVDMLHTQFCNLNHDIGECRWYDEVSLNEHHSLQHGREWQEPYHLAWANLFREFLLSTKLIKFIPEAVAEEPSS